MSWEGVRLRYYKYKRKLFAKYDNKKIKNLQSYPTIAGEG